MSALDYTVRRSDRARRARIQVSADGVEVIVPRRLAMAEVEPFLAEKRPWIERTLRKLAEAEAERPAPRLEDGGVVSYLGQELELAVKVEPARTRSHVARRGGRLVVKVPAGDPEAIEAVLESWYRRRAREEVAWRLDDAVARAGTRYTRLTIRAQRTRWASCSAAGAMSFNWRLLLAPAEILDYVVEHEVCHLEIHDHSDRFWHLLERRMPGYREHERWLRMHGQTLRLT